MQASMSRMVTGKLFLGWRVPLLLGCGAASGWLSRSGAEGRDRDQRDQSQLQKADGLIANVALSGLPAVVAASALAGLIRAPTNFNDPAPPVLRRRAGKEMRAGGLGANHGRFLSCVRGCVLSVDKDTLKTDGIYGGKDTTVTR